VRLFGLESGLIYKKTKGRSWETCRSGLSSYIDGLRSLADPPLTIDTPLSVADEKGFATSGLKISWTQSCAPILRRWRGYMAERGWR
jgi:hypothetical protein